MYVKKCNCMFVLEKTVSLMKAVLTKRIFISKTILYLILIITNV